MRELSYFPVKETFDFVQVKIIFRLRPLSKTKKFQILWYDSYEEILTFCLNVATI